MPKPARTALTGASLAIGSRLRKLRKDKNFSQDEIEKRTGMMRSYISRVENHHTVPSVETLEKLAAALEVPLHRLFYDGKEPPPLTRPSKRAGSKGLAWTGESAEDHRFFEKVRRQLARINEKDRKLLLAIAAKLASH